MATGSSCATKRLQRAAWHVACFAWRAKLPLLAHALTSFNIALCPVTARSLLKFGSITVCMCVFVPVVASSSPFLLPKACWRWSCKSGDPEIQPLLLVKIFANNATAHQRWDSLIQPMPCCLAFDPGSLVWNCFTLLAPFPGWLRWLERSHQALDTMKHTSHITIAIPSHPQSRISVRMRISCPRAEFLPEVFFAKTEILPAVWNFSRHTWKSRRISELRLNF